MGADADEVPAVWESVLEQDQENEGGGVMTGEQFGAFISVEPGDIQHTLSREAWRNLYAAAVASAVVSKDDLLMGEGLIQHIFDFADRMVREQDKREGINGPT